MVSDKKHEDDLMKREEIVKIKEKELETKALEIATLMEQLLESEKEKKLKRIEVE